MMKTWRLVGLGIAALSLMGALFTGCDESTDDNSDGVNPALVGIWRYTQMSGADTLNESTTQLFANGHASMIEANFTMEQCMSMSGLWSASEDSITTIVTVATISDTTTVAFDLNGNQLTITNPDGSHEVYSKIQSMPGCDDYGFSTPTWEGTVSATINGTVTDFSDEILVQSYGDSLIFSGLGGSADLTVATTSSLTGHYTLPNAWGVYMPDVADYMNSFYSTAGNVDIITSTTDHIVCTFNFEMVSISGVETRSITAGSADITAP